MDNITALPGLSFVSQLHLLLSYLKCTTTSSHIKNLNNIKEGLLSYVVLPTFSLESVLMSSSCLGT